MLYKRILLFCCLVNFMAYTNDAVGQNNTLLYGMHTDPGLIYNYPDTVVGFVQKAEANEYSALMYMIFVTNADSGMDYWFESSFLETQPGWNFRGDHIGEMVSEAKKSNMKVYADIQHLNSFVIEPTRHPAITSFTINHLINIVADLASLGIDGVSEELYPTSWYEPLKSVCDSLGLAYIHKAVNWDFGGVSGTPEMKTIFDIYPLSDIVMSENYTMGMYPPYIVGDEHFSYMSNGMGKEYQIKVCQICGLESISNMINMILLKAIQFKPTYAWIMTWNKNFFENYDFDTISNLISDYSIPEDKPLCNVILYMDPFEITGDWGDFPPSLAAVTTGVKASGYDIITTDTPRNDADMYHIVTRGVWGNWGEPALNLPKPIMDLFDREKPLFLEVNETLPYNSQQWRTIRTKLGIDSTKAFDLIQIKDTILYGNYKGTAYPHLFENSYFLNITLNDVKSADEVLSTVIYDSIEYALIIRKGTNYFINGKRLDMRASYPISNIINDGLQKPTPCVVTSGEKVSIFYALESGGLDIKLPDTTVDIIKWFKRDINGATSEGTNTYNSKIGYSNFLQRGTLLILKTSKIPDTTISNIDKRNTSTVQLLRNYPNPFNNTTIIDYYLPENARIDMAIYDIRGRKVKTLYQGTQHEGTHSVIWDGNDDMKQGLLSGVYFCKLQCGKYVKVTKLFLLNK